MTQEKTQVEPEVKTQVEEVTKAEKTKQLNLADMQKAFATVTQVCHLYKGTLQEHQAIQQALSLLKPKN